jgi:hypothetical protein
MTFVLYHEMTHGVIDLLDVPSTGGEEADADCLATIRAVASGPDGQTIPLAAGQLFAAQEKKPQSPADLAAAGYQLPQPRYFNVQCLVYGSDPTRNANLVGGANGIPPNQAESCVFEYQRQLRSWHRLLGAWLRNSEDLPPQRH